MKKRKPEVLIIGEGHPGILYKILLLEREIKQPREELIRKLKRPASIIKTEIALIKNFGTQRILGERQITTRTTEISSKLFKERNLEDFQKEYCQAGIETARSLIEELNRIGPAYGFPEFQLLEDPDFFMRIAKILSFIIRKTGVYDVKFFEDDTAGTKEDALDELLDAASRRVKQKESDPHATREEVANARQLAKQIARKYKKALKERERLMIRNIKTMLIDKTVVICGADHAEAIKKGLKRVATAELIDLWQKY